MKKYESLVDALDKLREQGYEADFATETFCLYCGDLDIRLDAEDFHIDEAYHFEGGPGRQDDAVLYAITSVTGLKGTLVDSEPGTDQESPGVGTKLRSHTPILR